MYNSFLSASIVSSIFFSVLLSANSAIAQFNNPPSEGLPSIRRVPLEDEEGFPLNVLPFSTEEKASMSPSVTIVTPSAYGASWGQIGIGVSYQERTRYTDNADGGIGFSFGLGNPQEYVGLQVGVALLDASDTFADGGVNLKLHRALPEDFNIAVGVQGIGKWGNTDGGSSVYGVVTKKITLKPSVTEPFSELYLNLGIGGGQFRSENDILDGVDSVGVYGGATLRIVEQVSFISEWSGQDLTLGISFVPFKELPLVITPAFTDITETAGDGIRFILGAGYQITF